MRRLAALCALACCLGLTACHAKPDADTVVLSIESSPNSLDPRQGTDAQSERIGGLLFDALVRKDEHYNLQPWLATSWEQPDPLTLILHIRSGVRFHDGRPLGAEDVAWSIHSMIDGTLVTAKSGAFSAVDTVEVRDPLTVVVHLKRPDAGLLFNMSDGLFGIVPKGAGRELGLRPVGSGPFRFVGATVDKEVVVERNPEYWGGTPKLERVRFAVIPDAITTALELRKGSADAEINSLPLDTVYALRNDPHLVAETGPSSIVIYANFNTQDPVLRDKRVRQAIASAIDRDAIIQALWRGQAKPAETLLPLGHWAAATGDALPQYPHDVARAQALLEAAGFHADRNGVRLRLTLKTSTDESTRLLATVLQQQLRAAGIALELRSAEFSTFYADITHGIFQMYILRWIGSNEDPDIFRYAYSSESFPPKGGNRGHYSNPRVDALLREAAVESDQQKRRTLYVQVEQILADELPGIPLWYPNNEIIHTQRLTGIVPRASGDYDFLRTSSLR